MTDRIQKALEKARSSVVVGRRSTAFFPIVAVPGAEYAAALAVIEAVHANIAGNWLETYCDVGAPDDCDHCVIVGTIHAWAAAVLGTEGGET